MQQVVGNYLPTFRESLLVTSFLCPFKMGPIKSSVRNYHYSLRNNPDERLKPLIAEWCLPVHVLRFAAFWLQKNFKSLLGLEGRLVIRSGCICAPHDSCQFNKKDACGMFSVDEIKDSFNNPVRRLYKTRGRSCSWQAQHKKGKRSSQNISRSVRRAITVPSNSKLHGTEHPRMGLHGERTHGTRVP